MDERDAQALRAVKLYYDKGLAQAEVAHELGVSRPTAAKLIALGHERGFVTISIHDPVDADRDLVEALKKMGGLTEVHLVRPPRITDADLLYELGRGGAQMLEKLVCDDMRLGVSWGDTMYAVSKACASRPLALQGVEIVQLKGGTSHSAKSTWDIATIRNFCKGFAAEAVTLPLPVIFDDPTTKQIVESDRHIQSVLDEGAHTDVCAFTVGDVHREALLLNLGYLTPGEIDALLDKAVGDACSRFFDREGKVAVPEIDERTVGITLETLKSRPVRLLVAGGLKKVEAITTALKIGLATHLVVDAHTARRIVENA